MKDISPSCPCGCPVQGTKRTKYGHVVGCICRSCLGRRNQANGKRGQRIVHRALGGTGFTPSNEESGRAYAITVQVEVKAGAQVPAYFARFIGTDWFRRALSQAERAIPVGVDALPAVAIQLPGDGRPWLIVRTR